MENYKKIIKSLLKITVKIIITFLHKFNPDQFELIKFRKGNDDKDLSIDGKCKTFDADADGYVRGEGCGVIILKPLSKAISDGEARAFQNY